MSFVVSLYIRPQASPPCLTSPICTWMETFSFLNANIEVYTVKYYSITSSSVDLHFIFPFKPGVRQNPAILALAVKFLNTGRRCESSIKVKVNKDVAIFSIWKYTAWGQRFRCEETLVSYIKKNNIKLKAASHSHSETLVFSTTGHSLSIRTPVHCINLHREETRQLKKKTQSPAIRTCLWQFSFPSPHQRGQEGQY